MPTQYTKLAIVYDFDGTLAPGNMQEHNFIPSLGMTSEEFWGKVNELVECNGADKILMYMKIMVEEASHTRQKVNREEFKKHGLNIEFFKGVEEWFDRIKCYGKEHQILVDHYLVSSGNEEIIAGTSIACKFTKIYASKFMFDEYGAPVWPAQIINFTTKTQYIFRINKGVLDPTNEEGINKYIEEANRPIPFKNMIYIGDGETDVPCFRLVKDLGGLSVAVYPPRTSDARCKAEQYITDGRVHCVVPADYTEGKSLDRVVKSRIDEVSARAKYERTLKGMRRSR